MHRCFQASAFLSHGAWWILVPYKDPSASRIISPILVCLLICSPRKTRIGIMTQTKSAATPKAKRVVSSFQLCGWKAPTIESFGEYDHD